MLLGPFESTSQSQLTMWKDLRMLQMTDTFNTVSGHYWQYSRNLSIVLTDSLSRILLPSYFFCRFKRVDLFLEEAEAEEAERKEADANKMTSLENLKYYTSLFLGTACIVNVFAFLFLVPFVLDPAISTLRHR